MPRQPALRRRNLKLSEGLLEAPALMPETASLIYSSDLWQFTAVPIVTYLGHFVAVAQNIFSEKNPSSINSDVQQRLYQSFTILLLLFCGDRFRERHAIPTGATDLLWLATHAARC